MISDPLILKYIDSKVIKLRTLNPLDKLIIRAVSQTKNAS